MCPIKRPMHHERRRQFLFRKLIRKWLISVDIELVMVQCSGDWNLSFISPSGLWTFICSQMPAWASSNKCRRHRNRRRREFKCSWRDIMLMSLPTQNRVNLHCSIQIQYYNNKYTDSYYCVFLIKPVPNGPDQDLSLSWPTFKLARIRRSILCVLISPHLCFWRLYLNQVSCNPHAKPGSVFGSPVRVL